MILAPSTSCPYIYSEVHEFYKGIQCDITLHHIFKDDWQYDSWYCDTHAIVSVHGTEDVFDSHYSPTETSEVLLWLEVKCFVFMFSVFCKNPQTSVGYMLLNHHHDSGDVQLITKELCNHYENSVYAQTHAQDIHANLTNLHITTWKEHSNHSSIIGILNGY